MPLTPGDKLGPYEILAPIGAGGMGEVYKARDAHLNREVAIKTLPPSLANDADYLARFQREAQTLATLHHPNIASIYGLEHNAIVMELAAGQTLRGPLPLTDALPIARQIAEALEAAHEKGIVHRDLKPGNIMVAPDGTIKVLDFGLAKSIERPHEASSNSPTLTLRATEAGLILGTAGYMSPEQAAGKPVDRRADIWAFGVVFYELLTGQRLFDGETVSHTLAAVLTKDIDLTPIPEGPIRDLIRRCLDRNLKNRLQHIGEARIAIDNHATNAKPQATTSHRPWAAAAGISLLAALAALAAWIPWFHKPAAPSAPTKLEVTLPNGSHLVSIFNAGGSAISPDGRTLAFVATNAKGESLLHVRSLDSLETRALPGTEEAARPFWSPDSKSIAFAAQGKLRRVDLAGGSPIALCDVRFGRGGTWNEEGVILFGDQNAGIQRISASGGAPTPVTQLNMESETGHYYPQFLPGGRKFLYQVRGLDRGKMSYFIGSLDGAPPVPILQTEFRAIYDPASKRVLYLQGNGTLMARTLDLNPPRLHDDPIVVAEGLDVSPPNGYSPFSVSNDGTLFYGRSAGFQLRRFAWWDRTGKSLGPIGRDLMIGSAFSLSPGGDRVAYTLYPGGGNPQGEVWVLELAGGQTTRITFNGGGTPRWSPDGKFLYYTNAKGIHRKAADGSGDEELLWKGTRAAGVNSVAPNGKVLLFGNMDIFTLPLDTKKPPVPFLQTQFMKYGAAFSPDGNWVAYISVESSRPEVYVQGFPDHRGKWLISAGGGRYPKWSADGKELYWARPSDQMLMATSIQLQPSSIRLGKTEERFRLPEREDGSDIFHPARDGRFLVLEPEAAQQELSMVVVQNWAARLGR